jgi:hypothetical protein
MKCYHCDEERDNHIDGLCSINSPDVIAAWVEDGTCDCDVYKFQPPYPKYVNAYRVTQAYGGPEEGGWWYDEYEPLESVVVESEEQEEEVRAALAKRYVDEEDVGQRRGRTSAAGGYDISIVGEFHFAKYEPEVKPHYE